MLLWGLAFCGVLPARAVAADKQEDAPIKVEVVGTVQTGIVAIGGETTGILVKVKGVVWELDPGKNQDLRAQAEKLNGKLGVISGNYQVKQGVEIRQRQIVAVNSLKAADDKAEAVIKVEVRGLLKAATGDEARNTITLAQGGSWELDVSKNKELQEAAGKLNNQAVEVAGTLEARPSTTPRNPRYVVLVKSLKAAEKPK
jgi:hypothetical protein